jgi:hypothetical protein
VNIVGHNEGQQTPLSPHFQVASAGCLRRPCASSPYRRTLMK